MEQTSKVRTIHELLQVMLDNKKYFENGLCHWNYYLYWYDVITHEEKILLNHYIENNKPFFNLYCLANGAYYWTPCRISPRIRWIKKHLKKTKPKQ